MRHLRASDGLACRLCEDGEKQVLDPKRQWSLWLRLLDELPRIVPCARLGAREVCEGITLGTQQQHGLRVTIEDIQQGRVSFGLIAPQQTGPDFIPELKGTARIEGQHGGNALLSTALCEGAQLHVRVADDGGPHDVSVTVYLLKPRPDDI